MVDHIELFTFMAGYQKRIYKEQDPVNIQAAELMGKIHDRLKEVGYTGHDLEVYLVRLLFCMFADDTDIFGKDDFLHYLKERTAEDGSDLAPKLDEFFSILNEPEEKRLKNLDEQLRAFPYINGNLFAESLRKASFDSGMRKALIECCELDWGKISPAIFGAMFQSVMNPTERRNLGAHYTSEKNIMKVIHSLFLDELWDEFRCIKSVKSGKKQRLNAFHDKIASLKFLDPACGCGNFLVITYRELRLLEIEILKELYSKEKFIDISIFCKIVVSQFYGIEIEEFPAQIAQVALWMMDHQMNLRVRNAFGQYFVRIPLKTAPSICFANAIPMHWEELVPPKELSYILGNPPFVGFTYMSPSQKTDMTLVFPEIKMLDYVACWFKKAAEYIQGTKIEVGFVATNSICQGESIAPLWKMLFEQFKISINFAHQTFKWSNEARGKAAVYCVIIGFSQIARTSKKLFIYKTVVSEPQEIEAQQINAYLVDAPNIMVESRNKPLQPDVIPMVYGNKATDGGFLIFNDKDYKEFIQKEPLAQNFFRQYVGSDEFINNTKRWVLWLVGCSPNDLRKMPLVMKQVESVKEFRLNSKKKATQNKASIPYLFDEVRHPDTNYLLIPRVSSERRYYIPIGFMDKKLISSDANHIIPNATLYHFGVLTSAIHMAWTRYVCGRLEMRYRYSKDIVYNNFPWPEPNEKQKAAIEIAAQEVLDVRTLFPDSSLADLYDPNTMPKELLKTHEKLDRLVEKAYRKEKFESDAKRVAFLFELYQNLTKSLPKTK